MSSNIKTGVYNSDYLSYSNMKLTQNLDTINSTSRAFYNYTVIKMHGPLSRILVSKSFTTTTINYLLLKKTCADLSSARFLENKYSIKNIQFLQQQNMLLVTKEKYNTNFLV